VTAPRDGAAPNVAEEHRRTEAAISAARTEGERQGARAQYIGTVHVQPDANRILAVVGEPYADGRMADAIVAEFRRAWARGADAMARFLAGGQ